MADVNIDVNVVAKQAVAILKGMEKQTKKNTSSFASLGKSIIVMNQGFELVKKFANVAKAAIGSMVNKAVEMEKVETQFQVFTKSAKKSKELLEDLQQFAATTPFQLPGLAKASTSLLSFGSTADEIVPRLKFLGDAASSTGADLSSLTLIFGQVQAAGKLTGERLLQLQERGVNLLPVLSKELGVTQQAVKKMVSEGKIDFDTFEKAFKSMSQEGGLFFQGMIKQSKTLGGVISTVGDNFDQIAVDIGTGFLPAMKQAGLSVITFLQKNRDLIKSKALIIIAESMVVLQRTLTGFVKLSAFSISSLNGLRNSFLELIASGLRWQTTLINIKKYMKEVVGANTELEEAERASLLIKQQTIDALKKENEQYAMSAFEKAETLVASIDLEFTKISEANVAKEEEETRHGDAMLTIAEITANAIAEAEAKKKADADKAAKAKLDKWNSYKLNATQELEQKKGAIVASGFAAMAAVAKEGGKKSFAIWKAASLAEAVTAGYLAVSKALASSPPPWNFVAAAAVGTQSALNVRGIAMTKPPAFENGGIVGGSSFSGDRVPALVNSGELILNRSQQDNVADQMTGGNIIFNITGDVVSEDSFIDKVVDGINNGTEFRNLKLRGAA